MLTLTLGPCINNDAMVWKLLMINRKGEERKREERSFLAPLLVPSQSIGRRSLSTLELECLSFTHQTICFIRFIFSPSDPAQPDKALMMKRRGHPCIISELACTKVCACACACVCVHMHGPVHVCVCVLVSLILLALQFRWKTVVRQRGQPIFSTSFPPSVSFLFIFFFYCVLLNDR